MDEPSGQNSVTDPPPREHGNRPLGARTKVGGIALVLLVAGYSLVAPQLNARLGWNLPQIRADSGGNIQLADTSTDEATSGAGRTDSDPAPNSKPGNRQVPGKQDQQATEELHYGLLREVSPDRYISPAGLLYGPGSAEGHRLEHLRRHTKDDPRRPGSHGVFDGDMPGALKTIDLAYERAKKGQRTTKKVDRNRTIYTVDLGKRIGYVGGRDGGRRRNPMARRVRIVVEGNRLITAYPL